MAYDYSLVRVVKTGRIAVATVDAPPINIITPQLYMQLAGLAREVEADDDVAVFILRSADPDFFLAHFDVGAIIQFPTDTPATRSPGNFAAFA